MAMPLKLITETVTNVSTLVEAVEGRPRAYYIEGIFMQGNLKNQNGRIYPTETLAREIQRYQNDYIARKRAFGELGHPSNPTVNLDRVSHIITELRQEQNDFFGRAKVTIQTPMGKIVQALIDEGAELGVSSRGLGSLAETDGEMRVQDDFFFSAVDIVADPSAPDAFVRGVMEGKEWVWENGMLKECTIAAMVPHIEAVHRPTVSAEVRQGVLVEQYKQFLAGLKTGVSIHTVKQ